MTVDAALFPAPGTDLTKMTRPSRGPNSRVADTMTTHLSVYFGPRTARSTVEHFSRRALARAPDELGMDDVRPLLVALRQPLRTLLGQAHCEMLIRHIEVECMRTRG
jgi:hypothetical protein